MRNIFLIYKKHLETNIPHVNFSPFKFHKEIMCEIGVGSSARGWDVQLSS